MQPEKHLSTLLAAEAAGQAVRGFDEQVWAAARFDLVPATAGTRYAPSLTWEGAVGS